MEFNLVTSIYIFASILFILSLGGLSNQESAKKAIWYGIIGMGLAIVGTILGPGVNISFILIIMLIIGSAIGVLVASRVIMTEMPQLVAVSLFCWFSCCIYRYQLTYNSPFRFNENRSNYS